MTDGWVIDASVGLAWVHPDQATLATDRLLREADKLTLVIPGLWYWEVAHTLLALQRRRKISASQRQSAIANLVRLNFVVDDADPATAFLATSETAEKFGLSVYDATYLAIAVRRKLSLASRDEALRKAAQRCGIEGI